MPKLIPILCFVLLFTSAKSQVIVFPAGTIKPVSSTEHGFLPGKKFIFYPTINTYDFNKSEFRVEVYDQREKIGIRKLSCTEIDLTNTSEFESRDCIYKLAKYADTLITQANAIVNPLATDTLAIFLEAFDARLIGFGVIRAHGLCQIRVNYKSIKKAYCVDITDADSHSPIGPNAFVTRKTATRIIGSAAMREVIEKFFTDLKSLKFPDK